MAITMSTMQRSRKRDSGRFCHGTIRYCLTSASHVSANSARILFASAGFSGRDSWAIARMVMRISPINTDVNHRSIVLSGAMTAVMCNDAR